MKNVYSYTGWSDYSRASGGSASGSTTHAALPLDKATMEDQETVGTIDDGANDRRSSVRQAAHQADEHTQISA